MPDAANAIDCELNQIVKSILFSAPGQEAHWLFLTEGGNGIDLGKASALAGTELSPANAAEVRAKSGFIIGGAAPIAHMKKRLHFSTAG